MKIKKILVSQPKPETGKSPYYELVEKYGVKIDFRPFIKVDPIEASEFRHQRINILDHTAITFTSRTGIDHFFRLCKELRVNVPEDMKYFCISESVAFYLQKYIQFRKRKVFYAASGKLPDLITVMCKHNAEFYLVVLSDNHNEEIIDLLKKNKLNFQVGLMYRTVSNDFTSEEEFNYDMLLFFSPQGVASLMKNFPDFQQGEIQIGCFGNTTAQAVRDAGLRLDLPVPTPEFSSMALALDAFIKENHKAAKK
ncbi:MAG: uroporphyrinogen-III synthase [Sphingobacteriia bacterium]|nr:uroporphyrinogen-III synthase [Paludibacteraceae bacterium]NCA79400.1 uroporphyrinogen-III synthase [Sphingobacteriia bacterium]